jgi:hypothetical protein
MRHDDATNAFNTCYKWAEENNVQAEGILKLKKIARKNSKKKAITKKNKKLLTLFKKKQSEIKP